MKNAKNNRCIMPSITAILIIFLILSVDLSILKAQAQYVTPDSTGNITFTPGLRIQTRYTYDQEDKNNDIFIRRLRLKGKGKVFDLGNYYFEVKIDNAGRFNRQPRAQVEKRLAKLSGYASISHSCRIIRYGFFQECTDVRFKTFIDGP